MELGPLVHQAILYNYEDDLREGVTISSIGYCELQTMLLHVRKERKPITPGNLLAMRTGTATHSDLLALLYKYRGSLEGFSYRVREKEVSILTPGGKTLRGHLDLAFSLDGIEGVADLKVIDEAPFNMLGSAPRAHEVSQVTMYGAALGVGLCRLLYLCKGGRQKGNFKEYPFAVDPSLVKTLLDKYDRIMDGKAEKPFKDPSDSWECGYCPYYEECWGKKTFTQKQEGVAEIPMDLEVDFIAAKTFLDQAQERFDEIKEKIVEDLAGKRGEGERTSFFFIQPKPSVSYDASLLEKYVGHDVLARCKKPTTQRAGYYNYKVRGD